jgi:hypothetical protein
MKQINHPAMLAAVAAGLLTGAYAGTRRSNDRSRRHDLVPIATPLQLPAARVQEVQNAPVIVDARYEEPAKRAWFPWALAVFAIFALLVTAGLAARPRFVALAAPLSVLAGSAATISYTTSGIGNASFTSNDANVQRSGPLGRSGSIVLRTTPQSRELIAVLHMQNALGTDARVVRIRVVPVPAPVVRLQASNEPVIRDFRLSKTSAQGGEKIAAFIASNALSGSVRLVDAAGAVWLSRPVPASGTVEFTVPLMHHDTPFIVVLHAQRNNRAIEASAGFIAQAKSTAPAVSHPMTQYFRQPSFTIPAVIHGGSTFAILVPPGLSGVSVSLSSKDGVDLAGPAMQRNDRVQLAAPPVSAPQQTFASVSFQDGKERETVIRRILIVP